MKKTGIFLGVTFLLAGMTAITTAQTTQTTELKAARSVIPHATEKHRALQILAGDWIITGKTYQGSPWGEGKFTAREHNEFMNGGMFLVSKTQYSEQFDNSSQIGFFGVDPKTGQYTFSMYNSLGIVVRVVGKLRDQSTDRLIGNAIYWGSPPASTSGGVVPDLMTEKEVNVAFGGGTMTYTTEFVSPNEYRFSMDRGGVRSYEGVARRVTSVN